MKYVFDLDGVIRDLNTPAFGYEPPEWNHKPNGKDLVDIMNEKLYCLASAPPTEYAGVIKAHISATPGVTKIITCQPEHWKRFAVYWLESYFAEILHKIDIFFVDSIQEKLQMLFDNETLIEDYPYFYDFEKIILIDRAYNQGVGKRRVKSPGELKDIVSLNKHMCTFSETA